MGSPFLVIINSLVKLSPDMGHTEKLVYLLAVFEQGLVYFIAIGLENSCKILQQLPGTFLATALLVVENYQTICRGMVGPVVAMVAGFFLLALEYFNTGLVPL